MNRDRYEIILKSMGEGIIAIDRKGLVELLNHAAQALTGWSNDEAFGQPLHEVFHIVNEETLQPFEVPVARILQDGLTVRLDNHILNARDGTRRPITGTAAPVCDEKGHITGVVMVFRDQTVEKPAQKELRKKTEETGRYFTVTLDLKQSEIALRESEERFRAIFNSTFQFTGLMTPDGTLIEANQAAINFAGLKVEDVINRPFWEARWWRGKEERVRQLKEAVALAASGEFVRYEVELQGDDNKTAIVDFSIKPVFNPDGKVTLLIPEGRDITDFRQVEENLYIKDRALASSFNAIVITDLYGNVTYVNDAFLHMWGYTLEEALTLNVVDLSTNKDEVIHIINDIKENGFSLDESIARRKDGSLFNIQFSVSLVTSSANEPIAMLSTFIDITERKRSEEALTRSEARFQKEQKFSQLLLDTSPALIVAIGFDGKTLMMNKALLDKLEYRRDEIYGKDYLNTFVPEEDRGMLAGIFQQIIQEGKGTVNINRIISRSGRIYLVEWHGRTVINEEEDFDFFVGVGIDITEQKQAEKEKQKLQDQLVQARKMEAIGRLAGGVAHDFNNMLTVIFGYVKLAMFQVAPTDPIRSDLEAILNAAERSASLTRQLLAFARKQTTAPCVLDLNDTVKGMLRMLLLLIREDIEMLWKPDSDLWPVKIDPAQIDQIMANLLVNARDSISGVGKITIETGNALFDEDYCASHAGFMPGEYVMLAVSDNGCGMSKETLSNIFEPFFTTKEPGMGSGLGLATVYGIVKQNNGFINIYSETGAGTTFKIYLPRYEGKTDPASAKKQAKSATGSHETVLLVEDEPMLLKLAKTMLEKLGYTVLTADTPCEAVSIAEEKAGKIQLLITDVVMPEMNGYDLSRRLLSLYPGLKCLFMSGYTSDAITHNGMLDKGLHFIQKPFSEEDLAKKIMEALEQK